MIVILKEDTFELLKFDKKYVQLFILTYWKEKYIYNNKRIKKLTN